MKKLLLTITGAALSFGALAQELLPRFQQQKKAGQETAVPLATLSPRPEAVLWSQNFNNTTGVSFSQTAGSSNGWKIVSAMEPNIANHPTHNFGSVLNSVSGAPFAFINSDSFASGTQNSSLILKVGVSLVGINEVQLSFRHYFRRFQESHIVEVSSDSTVWTEVYNSSLTVAVNTTIPNTQVENINISAAVANQPNVWIRFRYVGAWDWFWSVDDVEISEVPEHDLILEDYSITTANRLAFYGTNLASQLNDSLSFSAAVYNFGKSTQTNVRLNSSVQLSTSTVFNNSTLVGSMATTVRDTFQSNASFPLNTTTTPGIYTAKIEVVADSTDATPANNSILIPFTVADANTTRISVARPTFTASTTLGTASFTGSEDGFIAMSLIELITTDTITAVRIRLGSSAAGGLIEVTIRDTAGLFGTPAGGIDFPVLLEADLYTLSAADVAAGEVVVPIPAELAGLPQNRILQPGAYYAAATLYSNNGANHIRVLDDLTYERFQSSFASMIFTTDDNQWYPNGISFAIDGVFENVIVGNVENLENTAFKFGLVYPNPAQNELNLPYTLKTNAQVKISVRDLTGRLVYEQAPQQQNEGNQLLTLQLDQLRSGVYFVELQANGQLSRQKFVVNR